jgi:cell division protein FtsA
MDNIVVGLDIGTSKIGVVISKVEADGEIRIVGMGSTPSEGLRKGVVMNVEQAVRSIAAAIDEAQLMSGVIVKEVYVGISGKHIRSVMSTGMYPISHIDNEITDADVEKVIDSARSMKIAAEDQILHVIPQGYKVDGHDEITTPVGMSGERLEAEVNIITTNVKAAQNIEKSVQKNNLVVGDIILESIASSMAVLDEDEKELGVCLIDIGGGTTDFALHVDGAIRFTGCVELGGANVTQDLATVLCTPKEKAEEIKRKYGSCVNYGIDDGMVIVQGVGGRAPSEQPKHFIGKVIHARMKEILNLTMQELQKSKRFNKKNLGAGIVITGGGAQIPGIVELAHEVFNMPVKLGYPRKLGGGLNESVNSPEFSTALGLMLWGVDEYKSKIRTIEQVKQNPMDLLKKIGLLVKRFF